MLVNNLYNQLMTKINYSVLKLNSDLVLQSEFNLIKLMSEYGKYLLYRKTNERPM